MCQFTNLILNSGSGENWVICSLVFWPSDNCELSWPFVPPCSGKYYWLLALLRDVCSLCLVCVRYDLRRRWWPLCSPELNMFNLIGNCCSWVSKFQQPMRCLFVLIQVIIRLRYSHSVSIITLLAH